MREMKDSGIEWIGEIPKKWTLKRCKYLFTFINGYAFDSNDFKYDYKFPVIKIGDINNEKVNFKQCQGINTNEGLENYRINKNDILIAMSGATVGKIGYVNDDIEAYINQRVGIIRSDYSRYIFYSLCTNEFIEYVYLLNNSSAQPNISSTILGNYTLAIPRKEEMHRIVDFLDSKCAQIDSIIAKQEQIIEKLKEYKLSVITEAVTKGLNPDAELKDSGVESIGFIPKDWKICRLRNIGVPQNGISKGGEYFGSGDPFVSYGDVYRNYSLPNSVEGLIQSTEDEKEKYSVEEGDIFFTRTSETIDEVGFSCVCEKTIPNATFAGFLIRVRPFNKDSLFTGFAKYYFRSNHHRKYYAKEMNLVTRASLGQDLLKSVPILLPPNEEQRIIAKYLDKKCTQIEHTINYKEILIQRLSEYKKTLIYEVVTGKREV